MNAIDSEKLRRTRLAGDIHPISADYEALQTRLSRWHLLPNLRAYEAMCPDLICETAPEACGATGVVVGDVRCCSTKLPPGSVWVHQLNHPPFFNMLRIKPYLLRECLEGVVQGIASFIANTQTNAGEGGHDRLTSLFLRPFRQLLSYRF